MCAEGTAAGVTDVKSQLCGEDRDCPCVEGRTLEKRNVLLPKADASNQRSSNLSHLPMMNASTNFPNLVIERPDPLHVELKDDYNDSLLTGKSRDDAKPEGQQPGWHTKFLNTNRLVGTDTGIC